MSVPCGSTGPFFIRDRHPGSEITAHRDKVFAALSRHSDPALREIGRLLANDTVTPRQLLDDPRHPDTWGRIGRKPAKAGSDDAPPNDRIGAGTAPGTGAESEAGTGAEAEAGAGAAEAGPASRPASTDHDNGAGGVPAIRR